MRKVEPEIQTLISADKIYLLDHTIRQPPASFSQVRILTDANILGPKDQLDRLPFTKPSRFFFGRQTSGADFDSAAGHYTDQKICGSQKGRHVFRGRMIVNLVRCSDLFEMAFVKYGDVIAHLQS